MNEVEEARTVARVMEGQAIGEVIEGIVGRLDAAKKRAERLRMISSDEQTKGMCSEIIALCDGSKDP